MATRTKATTKRASPEKAPLEEPLSLEPRSERGKRMRGQVAITPLKEIRTHGGGGFAYYIRPEGATISDALVIYPNGNDQGQKYSKNASYYQDRQRKKGFTYIGPSLTPEGVQLLVKTLAANRKDEVLFLEDEIAMAEHAIKNSDMPQIRDSQRRRRSQLQARLDRVKAGFNANELIGELEEIAQAQRLAKVDPNVLAVMREMVGSVNQNLIAHFASKVLGDVDGQSVTRRNDSEGDPSIHRGVDNIDLAERLASA